MRKHVVVVHIVVVVVHIVVVVVHIVVVWFDSLYWYAIVHAVSSACIIVGVGRQSFCMFSFACHTSLPCEGGEWERGGGRGFRV